MLQCKHHPVRWNGVQADTGGGLVTENGLDMPEFANVNGHASGTDYERYSKLYRKAPTIYVYRVPLAPQ